MNRVSNTVMLESHTESAGWRIEPINDDDLWMRSHQGRQHVRVEDDDESGSAGSAGTLPPSPILLEWNYELRWPVGPWLPP